MSLTQTSLKLKHTLTKGFILCAFLFSGNILAEKTNDPSLQQDIKQMSAESQRYFQNGWREGKIETSFLFNEHLNNFDIDIQVTQSKALLMGIVSSDVQKDLAQQIALSVEGITEVDNRIKVSPDTKKSTSKQDETYLSAIEDASITAHVKTRLLTEGEVPGLKINVDTQAGKVTLQGKVESEVVKDLAGKIAENTRKVQSVDNQLEVKS